MCLAELFPDYYYVWNTTFSKFVNHKDLYYSLSTEILSKKLEIWTKTAKTAKPSNLNHILFPHISIYCLSNNFILQYDFVLPGNIKNGLGMKNNRDSSRLRKLKKHPFIQLFVWWKNENVDWPQCYLSHAKLMVKFYPPISVFHIITINYFIQLPRVTHL